MSENRAREDSFEQRFARVWRREHIKRGEGFGRYLVLALCLVGLGILELCAVVFGDYMLSTGIGVILIIFGALVVCVGAAAKA